MLQPFRNQFNQQFSSRKYDELRLQLDRKTRTKVAFRVCETPCFFPKVLMEELSEIGSDLTHQLMGRPDYLLASEGAVPPEYRAPGCGSHPNFMTVDFGLVREHDGSIRPKLVELQAFPSVFGYQEILAEEYVLAYDLASDLQWHLGGHTRESCWALLRDLIVGSHDPENVVLLEVDPQNQKTLPDFHVYEDRMNVTTVDIEKLRQDGNRLFYERQGRWIPIRRIFNRAIVDEMERKGTKPAFDFRDDLDVEWAGHPNWYFRISKFALPFLDHPSVPKAVFLDQWLAGDGRSGLPEIRDQLLLKPLYSFAGKGIQFAPTDLQLAAIPAADRHLYLIQERVDFKPVIETPQGLTQAEIRIMYVWPDGGRLEPVISLVRMGRGLMMGVDQNRNQEWVGGSAALFPST
jgi:hypothetical protein